MKDDDDVSDWGCLGLVICIALIVLTVKACSLGVAWMDAKQKQIESEAKR